MTARTVIELQPQDPGQSDLFRITVDGVERAAHLSAPEAEAQLLRITDRMRSREGPLSVIRHVATHRPTSVNAPCTWVPPECLGLFEIELEDPIELAGDELLEA
jgi:hypothetical protein